jgi:hypothetical protein
MTDKVFKEYFSENQKEYRFTLKLAVDVVTEKMMDKLESALARYEIKSATAFKRTPIQESPLDFPNVRNTPVYISEIVTVYPASRDFLETYISSALGITEQSVVVYSDNDPRGLETEFHLDVTSQEYKENYNPVLGEEGYENDITNEEASELYGEKYNTEFLKQLQAARDMRTVDIIESPLSLPEENDYAESLPSDYDSFNDQRDENSLSIFGRAPKKPSLINKS